MKHAQIVGEGKVIWQRKLRKVGANDGGYILTIPIEVVRYLKLKNGTDLSIKIGYNNGEKQFIVEETPQ